MRVEIIAALIGVVGSILAAAIGWSLTTFQQENSSAGYRRKLGLPDPLGHWKCRWFRADGSVYVADDVEIEAWVKNGRFRGKGTQPRLSYVIDGEIDGTRVMALTYRTVDFPTKAYVGVACLIFDVDGENLSGYWYGRASDGELVGGKTDWSRR
jgi:hypothetical protein